ncbi:unnamed protein product [Rotaria sp. Silwood2]|nr:unnamed protein product [Rotaria sp. Silwood2]CAF3004796.1 unnamed protein product [Rotaria sp. Silwood2]CAF4070413.1 unnamed protein product [Rotaria sp. Silwood2]
MDVENKIKDNTMKSSNNENLQTTQITNPTTLISSKQNKQKQMLKKQFKLVKNKQVRAVPGITYQTKSIENFLNLFLFFRWLLHRSH